MKNKILLLLLVGLGMSACKDKDSDTPFTYGTPTAEFTVTGRITDSLSTPASGIRIVPTQVLDIGRTDQALPQKLPADTVYTAEDGTYEIISRCRFVRQFNLVLLIDDIDDTENGGLFISQKDTIGINELNKVGQTGFLQTFYAKEAEDIIIKQVPKEEDEPETLR